MLVKMYFLLNWRGINPSFTSEEIYRKWNFLLYLQKSKNIIQLHKSSLLKVKKKLSLIPAGFYIFYHFYSDPVQTLKTKIGVKILNVVIVTSSKAYFIASMKTSNVW